MTSKSAGVVGISLGVGLGLCFGASLGVATQSAALGIAFGAGLGVAFALALSASDAASPRRKVVVDKPLPDPLGLFVRDEFSDRPTGPER